MNKYKSLVLTFFLCGAVISPANAQDESQLANSFLSKTQSILSKAVGDDMPDWAKRVDFNIGLNEDFEPTGSILTVQPLYQDEEKKHTFFTQLSYFNYEQFDDRKNTTNVGLGYRHITIDNSLLLGANVFYDHEWDEGHDRLGFGVEAKMAMLDLTANYYNAISGKKDISATVSEQALDGYDLELRSQVPYMPWARAGIGYFKWDGRDFDDVYGIKASIDMDVTPNFAFEVGLVDDNDDTQDTQVFANLTYSFGNKGQVRSLSDNTGTFVTHGLAERAFIARDMRNQTLNKVRRQNKIVTERNSVGITVSRGN